MVQNADKRREKDNRGQHFEGEAVLGKFFPKDES